MNRLSIVLAARNRPELLVQTLARTLPNMALPDTRILVALDDDDPETVQAAQDFADSHRRRVTLSVQPREDSLGEKFNRVLAEAPADVYLAMVDYAPHITPSFDRLIMEAASLFPDQIGVVFNTQSVEASVLSAINAVTHRLAELMGGFYPPYYPYWFVDHHLHDIAHMIGRIAYADVELDVSRRPGTMELREPTWWATFCDLLMPQRQEIARKIIAVMDDEPWRKTTLLGAFPHHAHTSWFINECMRTHPWDTIPHETNTADARYQRIRQRAIETIQGLAKSYEQKQKGPPIPATQREAPAMKIDATQLLLNFDGTAMMVDQKIVDNVPTGGKPATLGRVIVDALMAVYKGEEEMTGSKKMERFALASKLHGAALPVDITDTEAETILTLVNKAYGILVYGRIDQMITEAKAAASRKPVVNGHADQPAAQA